MKYNIVTYGCQMNEHDSERIAGILENLGYEKTEKKEDADFILYNTCLVRENAELKVYGQLGSLKKWKKSNPNSILAVSGCMMQTGPAKDIISEKYQHVDIIFGTKNIDKLPILIQEHLDTKRLVIDTSTYEGEAEGGYLRESEFTAYVNIMTGCNNYCTYCVVPYSRGREKSRSSSEILNEVKLLAERGVIEITLLGQNVNSYKSDMTFPELLKAVSEVEGIQRVRFTTSHPKDLSDELIEVLKTQDKVENHIHLPLQSGSSRILKLMNRHYTKESYLELIKRVREQIPNIAISTDIIVGFPGETEEDHQETLDIVRQVRYDTAFTFLYSARPGTPAAKRVDDFVDESVKSRRFKELTDTLYPIFKEKNESDIGKIVYVLAEGTSKNRQDVLSGRSSEGKLVHFKPELNNESIPTRLIIGKIVPIKVTGCTSFTLEGELVSLD